MASNPLDTIITREWVTEMRDYILTHPRWRRPGAPSPECAWGIYYDRVVNRLTYRALAERHGTTLERTRQICILVWMMLFHKFTGKFPRRMCVC